MVMGAPQTNFERKKNKAYYIISKRIHQRFRISLDKSEVAEFRNFMSNFASWSQKSSLCETGPDSKVFLSIKCYEIGINEYN